MAFAPTEIVECRLNWLVNGQRLINVLHYRPVGGDPEVYENNVALDALANDILDPANGHIGTNMLAVMSNQVTLVRLDVQRIFPVRYRARDYADGRIGNVEAPCDAQNVQASITKYGPEANRHNVGGMRLGGLPETAYVAGLITAPFLDDIDEVAQLLHQIIEDPSPGYPDWWPAILNKTKVVVEGKDKYQISGAEFMLGAFVQPQLRVLRRRNVGNGI